MPPPRPPPTLADDAVGEILLRFPPDDPASLIRASHVCRAWHHILSDPAFPYRYRVLHRAPPTLGFLHNYDRRGSPVARLIPTTVRSPLSPRSFDDIYWWAFDCRHGRALFHSVELSSLIVWDPITRELKHVPLPMYPYDNFTAAVLCATDGCDHLRCSGGPFLVVISGTVDADSITWVSVYSSEIGAWSKPASIHIGIPLNCYEVTQSSVLAGDALYFPLEDGQRVLKYNLRRHVLSVISLPRMYLGNLVLITWEDGTLGIAGVKGYSLHICWYHPDGDSAEWVPGRVIELDMMLSIAIGDPSTRLRAVGFAQSAGTIFIRANTGIFVVETKSGQVRKVAETVGSAVIFPYESFYTPDHAGVRLQGPTRLAE